MFRTKALDPLERAAFVLSVNTETIPVNARMVRVLWEGVRELYRRDLLTREMRTQSVQFHIPTLNAVIGKLKRYQHWIDNAEYPESTRIHTPTVPVAIEITDWIMGDNRMIPSLDDVISRIDDVVVTFAEGLMRLCEIDEFKHDAIAGRLYMEMADLISLSEVLINGGYRAENNLFKNFFGRVFTRKRPDTTK